MKNVGYKGGADLLLFNFHKVLIFPFIYFLNKVYLYFYYYLIVNRLNK